MPASGSEGNEEIAQSTPVASESVLDVALAIIGTPWPDGFNGQIRITNTSGRAISSWEVLFKKPSDLREIAPWGTANIETTNDGFIRISNKSWNGNIAAGTYLSIGFGGVGTGLSQIEQGTCRTKVDFGSFSCTLSAPAGNSYEGPTTSQMVNNVVSTTQEELESSKVEPPSTPSESTQAQRVPTVADQRVRGLTQGVTPTSLVAVQPTNFNNGIVSGYLSDWSVYDRAFDPSRLDNSMPYNRLVLAFAAICGDQGTKSGLISTACQQQGREEFEMALTDTYADFEKAVSPRQETMPYPEDHQPSNIRGMIEQLTYMRSQSPDLKIAISIGGWTFSEPFHRMAASAASRQKFITSVKEFVDTYGFDGVDVDWEFPGHGGEAGKFTADDGRNYATLVCEMKAALPNKEISSAIGASKQFIDYVGIHYQTIADGQCLDNIYLMNYDFFGSWDSRIGHQASLYPTPNAERPLSVEDAVEHLTSYGLPKDRLIVGIANYTRGVHLNPNDLQGSNPVRGSKTTSGSATIARGTYEAGIFERYDMYRITGDDFKGASTYDLYTDTVSNADFYYSPVTNNYYSIDTARTAYAKAKYAREQGLGGVFVWTVEHDDGTIVNAMNDGMRHFDSVAAVDTELYATEFDSNTETQISSTNFNPNFNPDGIDTTRLQNYLTCGVNLSAVACGRLFNGELNIEQSNDPLFNNQGLPSTGDGTGGSPLGPDLPTNVPELVNPEPTNPAPTGKTFTTAEITEIETQLLEAEPNYVAIRNSIRTRDNTVVEAITPGDDNNPGNVKQVEAVLVEEEWDHLFAARAPEYTYTRFLQAVGKFPALCDVDVAESDADKATRCKKTLATMFAHFVQETGGHQAGVPRLSNARKMEAQQPSQLPKNGDKA